MNYCLLKFYDEDPSDEFYLLAFFFAIWCKSPEKRLSILNKFIPVHKKSIEYSFRNNESYESLKKIDPSIFFPHDERLDKHFVNFQYQLMKNEPKRTLHTSRDTKFIPNRLII